MSLAIQTLGYCGRKHGNYNTSVRHLSTSEHKSSVVAIHPFTPGRAKSKTDKFSEMTN